MLAGAALPWKQRVTRLDGDVCLGVQIQGIYPKPVATIPKIETLHTASSGTLDPSGIEMTCQDCKPTQPLEAGTLSAVVLPEAVWDSAAQFLIGIIRRSRTTPAILPPHQALKVGWYRGGQLGI